MENAWESWKSFIHFLRFRKEEVKTPMRGFGFHLGFTTLSFNPGSSTTKEKSTTVKCSLQFKDFRDMSKEIFICKDQLYIIICISIYHQTDFTYIKICFQRAWECSQRGCSSARLLKTDLKTIHESAPHPPPSISNQLRTNTLPVMRIPGALPRESTWWESIFHLLGGSSQLVSG